MANQNQRLQNIVEQLSESPLDPSKSSKTKIISRQSLVILIYITILFVLSICQGEDSVRLPEGVKAVWDVEKAYRQSTPTRERICINGLWRWQPADRDTDAVPSEGWGYFKVPGCWPGISDYMQKDSQKVYIQPRWKDRNLRTITSAWYQRQITIPVEWAERRINIQAEYVNSYAQVYLDGRNAGTIVFPGGQLDITAYCRPGDTHVLSIFITAMPLKAVLLSYTDTASAKEVKGSVARRGLCGDVYLESTPPAAHITDVKVDTSVRKWQITFDAKLDDLVANVSYIFKAEITENNQSVAEFTSETFEKNDLANGHFSFTKNWKPEKLWDIHTPQNMYHLRLSLLQAGGKVIDTDYPKRFGFREFWIDGRDFFLNGSRVFLSCVPLDNAQIGAALANYEAAKESLERLKSFGINFVYTHNYGCQPGSHLSFTEILKAADDVGMLVALSQPHFSHYDWEMPDADETNGYARHAEYYV